MISARKSWLLLIVLLGSAGMSTESSALTTRFFKTSEPAGYPGNFGGLAGGDAICQARADAVSAGGTWIAWLSDSKTDAKDRLTPGSGPFVAQSAPSQVIANDIDDLTDGTLLDFFNLNANVFDGVSEVEEEEEEPIWTGTLANGKRAPGDSNCDDWSAGGANGLFGDPGKKDSEWTDSGTDSCAVAKQLYCLEVFPDRVSAQTPWQTALLALGMVVLVVSTYRRRTTAR